MSYGFYKDQVFCVSRLKLLQALSDASLGHTPLRVLDFSKQSFTISSEVDDKPSETRRFFLFDDDGGFDFMLYVL